MKQPLPRPDDPAFAKALRDAREARDWNRTELARRADIDPVMPKRYEEGTTVPSMTTWKALNRALGLLPPQGETEQTTEPAAPLPAPVVQQALRQATVEELVDALVARGLEPTLRPLPRPQREPAPAA